VRKIKKKTSLTMDENLIKQAKDNNLNMSALAEEAIKNALNETNNLQRLKIRKTKLKQQIEQNTVELERVEELIEMEIKEGKFNKIILCLAIIGMMGLLSFPFVTNNLISTTLTDDLTIEYSGEVEVLIPNRLGTTTVDLGNYYFSDDNVTRVKLINPSYLYIE